MDLSILGKLRKLLSRRHRVQLVILFMMMCIGASLETIGIASIPIFVSILMAPEASQSIFPFGLDLNLGTLFEDTNSIIIAGILLVAFFGMKNLFLGFIIYFEGRLLRNVSVFISNRLFNAYLHSEYELHLHRNSAQSIRNLTSEVDLVRLLFRTILQASRELLVLAMIAVLLMLADPAASLSALILLGLSAGLFFFSVRKRLRASGLQAQQYRKSQLQWINQGLGSLSLAKLMAREGYLAKGFQTQTLGHEHELFVQKFLVSLPRLFLEIAALIAVAIVAGSIVILGKDPSILLPTLALLSVSAIRMVPSIVAITAAASQMEAGRAAVNIVAGELEHFSVRSDNKIRLPKSQGTARQNTSNDAVIEFDQVSFEFDKSDSKALTDISFEIREGEAIGIVGPSGAGKSTLVALMLQLLDPTNGNINVDHGVEEANKPTTRSRFGYVPQQVYLLDLSVKENIAFGVARNEIDMDAVVRAAEAAQINEFIESLPNGYETQAGDRGARFSGGQIQRLGIARALYFNPKILVLDESTSALDGETERSVIQAIEGLKGSRTMIIIAHKLSTIRLCERILSLDNGRLIADTSLEEFRNTHDQPI